MSRLCAVVVTLPLLIALPALAAPASSTGTDPGATGWAPWRPYAAIRAAVASGSVMGAVSCGTSGWSRISEPPMLGGAPTC